ncbi:MAG: MarR family transcriptional regulator, partial [Candidatus Odinarchaeota archaeon]
MNSQIWFLLLRIAEMGNGELISTTSLSSKIGFSQQSASRYIRMLEKQGLITRRITGRGQFITLTGEGLNRLREVYNRLKIIFGEAIPLFIIKGVVFTGLGEGAYYMSKKGY